MSKCGNHILNTVAVHSLGCCQILSDSEVHKVDEDSEERLMEEIDDLSKVDYDELEEVSEVGEAYE